MTNPDNRYVNPETHPADSRYIRCRVRSHDSASFTVVTGNDGDGMELRVSYGAAPGGDEYGYLRGILRKGMRLNLLDTRMVDNKVVAGEIVVEPDFLVDISSLAACFEDFGHHPLLYTLNRLKKRPNTYHIILGNFAGMVLDDVMKAQMQYLNPYILEERQLNVTQMDVFSRLMMDRIIFLGTQIDDYTANTLQAQLLYLDSVDSGKDISIYINSPGGSVTAGLGIYDTMQFISSDVATICTGMAASMAAVLLVAGTEGKRSALTHSRVMIHQPLGGVQGQASDIEIEAKEILKFKKELYTIISEHSHTPYEKVYKDSDRNYWMTAEEAKEYGMIDEVLIRKK